MHVRHVDTWTSAIRASTERVSMLLLLCCAWALLISLANAAQLGTAANPIKVCVQETRPYVFVDNSTGTPRVYGYEPDLFSKLAKAQGYVYETRVIVQFFDLLGGLELPATDPLHCDLGMSGMGTANVPISDGVRYSQTIFRNGMSVVTTVASSKTKGMWAFGQVFAVDLWVALIITAFVLGLMVLVVERDFKNKGLGKIRYPMEVKPGMIEGIYQAFSKLVSNSNGIPGSSIAAKLISIGWGLVVLVIISSYTAGLTTSLTVSNLQSAISSFKDLSNPGLVIGSWFYYRDSGIFNRFGFRPVGLPWNSQPDVNAMIDQVAAGQLDAVVLDTGILRYNIGRRCDVQIVGPVFLYSEIVFPMHASVTTAFMNQFNNALVQLQDQGVNEALEAVYMPDQTCSAPQVGDTITFDMVKGVFVVLGALTGLGLVLALLPKLSKHLETDTVLSSSRSDVSVASRVRSMVSRSIHLGGSTHGGKDVSSRGDMSAKTDGSAADGSFGASVRNKFQPEQQEGHKHDA